MGKPKFTTEEIREALERLRARQDHYLNCSVYHQGIITVPKKISDSTYECTCGWIKAIRVVKWYAIKLPKYAHMIKASLPSERRTKSDSDRITSSSEAD